MANKTTGAIQDKTEKHGVTRGRSWTRTTITVNGEQYSTLNPVTQIPGTFVSVEYNDGNYGHSILSVKPADNITPALQNPTTAPTAAKLAQSGAPAAVFEKYENELASIENYISQISANIQTLTGKISKIELDLSDFMKEQAEKKGD